MKTSRFLLPVAFAAVLFAGCASLSSVPAFDPADGRVTVTFDHPEKFTDARDGSFHDTAAWILNDLAAFLQRDIRGRLHEGEKFSMTFTDVDLAGDYEPWRGPDMDDVRIIKQIYPPRLVFRFVHTGANGKVIDHGDVTLTDLGFQRWTPMGRSDPLYYEKDLLRSWVRQTLTTEIK
ncbi:MAG: DUF3016 domain-containing protein [Opitutaceae bacterium]